MTYSFLQEENLFVPVMGRGEFPYKDVGSSEEYVYEVVRTAKDRSALSNELAAKICDWPSTAHLSPLRGNLLRPFAEMLRGRVLEVGAGCGAVTTLLGEFGGEVTALEPSYGRARICAERTRGLPNVKTVCDTLAKFKPEHQFDAVVVVGVLEYAEAYGDFSSFGEFLERCRSFLTSSGVLFVAIENQLGVKYLAGTREDHLGQQFIGVNDGYKKGGVHTFTKEGLTALLKGAGFRSVHRYAPFPDYKLPKLVVSERVDSFRKLGVDVGTLLHGFLASDPQLIPEEQSFSIEQVYKLFARNGNLLDVANSFLFIASPSEGAVPREQALCSFYSVEVQSSFRKESSLVEADGEIVVRRRHLIDAPRSVGGVTQRLEDSPYIEGRLWTEGLLEIMNRRGWSESELVPWCRRWLEEVVRCFGSGDDACLQAGLRLSPEALDATPFNMIITPTGAYRVFDLEWVWESPVELGWVFTRGLAHCLRRITSIEPPAPETELGVDRIVERVGSTLGLGMTAEDLRRYSDYEDRFHQVVLGAAYRDNRSEIERLRLRVRRGRGTSEVSAIQSMLRTRFHAEGSSLAKQIEVLTKRLESNEQERLTLRRENEALRGRSGKEGANRSGWWRSLGLRGLLRGAPLFLRKALSARWREQVITSSGLFDESWYRAKYAGFLQGGLKPLDHYLEIGEAEGFAPCGLFDPGFYRARYPDVAAARQDPFMHFVRHGASEGRSPCALFDTEYYVGLNPDVKAQGINPLRHFMEFGWREGRNPHPEFDVRFYLGRYADVRESGENPLVHYLESGAFEGRWPNPEFDSGFYLACYPDVAEAGINPLRHYLESGRQEGRQPSAQVGFQATEAFVG